MISASKPSFEPERWSASRWGSIDSVCIGLAARTATRRPLAWDVATPASPWARVWSCSQASATVSTCSSPSEVAMWPVTVSASMSSTRWWRFIWSVAARFVARVVLPTPPFGLKTATIIARRASARGSSSPAARIGPLPSSKVWARMSMASTRQRSDSALYGRVKYSVVSSACCEAFRRSKARCERTISVGTSRPSSWRLLYSSSEALKSVSPSMTARPMSRRSRRSASNPSAGPASRTSKPASRSPDATSFSSSGGSAQTTAGRAMYRVPFWIGRFRSGLGLGVPSRDIEHALAGCDDAGGEAGQHGHGVAERDVRIMGGLEHELAVRSRAHADRLDAGQPGQVALEGGDRGDADEPHDDHVRGHRAAAPAVHRQGSEVAQASRDGLLAELLDGLLERGGRFGLQLERRVERGVQPEGREARVGGHGGFGFSDGRGLRFSLGLGLDGGFSRFAHERGEGLLARRGVGLLEHGGIGHLCGQSGKLARIFDALEPAEEGVHLPPLGGGARPHVVGFSLDERGVALEAELQLLLAAGDLLVGLGPDAGDIALRPFLDGGDVVVGQAAQLLDLGGGAGMDTGHERLRVLAEGVESRGPALLGRGAHRAHEVSQEAGGPAGSGGRRRLGGGGSLDGGRGHRRLICRWRGVGRCHGSVVGDELVGLRRLGGRAASPEAESGALFGRSHRQRSSVFGRCGAVTPRTGMLGRGVRSFEVDRGTGGSGRWYCIGSPGAWAADGHRPVVEPG